eukprot:TRINITY_DN8512_c0_g1_i2.p1 TRINITY_DN8512_c0_g1~~TRINITY_DN8512_c0_g1_i2.p1  ORF type:complete len:576 (+),score=167.37 TRINITY_DN8512_c0_g1_i2:124-1851(+)
MRRRPPRSTLSSSSAASDVYKRQYQRRVRGVVARSMTVISEDDLSDLASSLDEMNPYDTMDDTSDIPDHTLGQAPEQCVGATPRQSAIVVEHRLQHEADVLKMVMVPKIWKEDFLQGHEQEEHRKAAWSELFFDLTYVAAGLKLGENLKADVSWEQVGEFALLFIPLFTVWLSVTIVVNRFCVRDLLTKAVFVLIFICTVVAALHLDDGLGSHGFGYFVCLAGAYTVLGAHSFYIGCRLERARRVCHSDACLHLFSAVLFLLVGGLPGLSSEHEKVMRALGIAATYAVLFGVRHARDRWWLRPPQRNHKGHITMRGDMVPIHIGLMHERMALMIVIVLGESVLGIILPELQQTAEFLTTAAAACVLICCIQYLYFEVDALRFSKHAMQRRHFNCCFKIHPAWFWMNGHMLLMILNLMVGVGIKSALSLNDSLKTKYRLLLTGSAAASIGLSFMLHILHRLPSGFKVSTFNRGIVRLVATSLIVALGFISKEDLPAWALMSTIAFIAVGLVLFEFFASRVRASKCFRARAQQAPPINADGRMMSAPPAPRSLSGSADVKNDEDETKAHRSNFDLDV